MRETQAPTGTGAHSTLPESTLLVAPQSTPAPFWPDVFVENKFPWLSFFQSGGVHILAIALLWAGSRFLALQPRVTPVAALTHDDVVYYTPAEYLPPLDTRRPQSARATKADPEFSPQLIISVPPEADNRSQTIVTPPKIKLQRDISLPNTVAWSDAPRMPIAPAPTVSDSHTSRSAPQMESSVVAPPPDVDITSQRRLGDLNVGHSTIIAPAPQLSLDEQRAPMQSAALRENLPQVIAPPPSVGASGARSANSMIALSLHPSVEAPPAPVAGNRRGTFAATPEGHRGASGSPGSSAGGSAASGTGAGTKGSDLPSGLYVGKSDIAKTASSVNPKLMEGARRPVATIARANADSDGLISAPERAVFGDRRVYSLSLNMPNLNSAGGSWIIRFAALKPSSTASSSSDLSSPVATRKVDPAYPLELMRQNVSGTVILYAVIHADGTVGSMRVLRSVDDRLDQFASEAIAKWHFQPATRNGDPVDVEATFCIPFRPTRVGSNF